MWTLFGVPELANQDMMSFWVDLRSSALNYWLRNLQGKGHRAAPAKVKTHPDRRSRREPCNFSHYPLPRSGGRETNER